MEEIRRSGNISLNKGDGPARGLFNVSNGEGSSMWFDANEKDNLMEFSDQEFEEAAEKLIEQSKYMN